jgi:hypothetical protein
MKKLTFLLTFFTYQMLFAQSEKTVSSHFSNNNISFSLAPTFGHSSVVPSATSSAIKGTRLLGFQTQLTYMHKFDDNLSFELGAGFGTMQNGFEFNFDRNKYFFLSRNTDNVLLNHNFTYLYIPAKAYYYIPFSDKRKLFASVGTNFNIFLLDGSNYRFNDLDENGKSFDLVSTRFEINEANRNFLTLGFGTERALRRRNAIRWNLEFQLGFKKITNTAQVIQPDRTYASEQFFTRGSVVKLGCAYVFSNKKESNVIPKAKFFHAQKGDITFSIDLGLNGTFRNINDPQKLISYKTQFIQAGGKATVEYFYANNRSVGLNIRRSTQSENFSQNDGRSRSVGGSSEATSYGMSHQWYKGLGKRFFWKTGIGASLTIEKMAHIGGGHGGSSNAAYFQYAKRSTGNFVLLDLNQSLEFNLSPALRLCLDAQYSQGTTKAYLYDFDMHLTKDAYQFQGFSRGSNLGLSLGLKANLGFLRR